MAVYTQGVDPNSFQTTGYQLPVNQIIQAVATRNAYWDIGASQLKNAYNRNLNLSLTLGKNKEQLSSLMKGVDAGLKTAAQADLSIAPNVNDAMKIFDPIVKNENIMGDHAITSHYQKEMQRADSLRNLEGGKYYNQKNVADLMHGLNDFAKTDDPTAWKEHYAKRRNYQDYYDVQGEIKELRRTFKPNITSTTVPGIDPKTGKNNSLYLTTTIDKSSYENQWKAYLSANLSDKARNQLALEGRVAFYEREPDLLRAYSSYTNDKITSLRKQRAILQGAYDSNQKDLTPEMSQIYLDQLGEFDNNIKDLTNEKKKLDNGDPSTLANDQDRVAGLVYSDSYLDNIARSLEVKDMEITMKPDTAAINDLNQRYANYRTRLTVGSRERIANAQLAMERMKLAAKQTEAKYDPKNFLEWDLGVLSSGPDNERSITKDLYEKTTAEYSKKLDDKRRSLYKFLEDTNPKFKDYTDEASRQSFIENWISNPDNRNLPVYRAFRQAHDMYNNQKVIQDAILQDAEAEARRNYPSVFKDIKADAVKVDVVDPTTGKVKSIDISGDEVKKIAIGTSTRYKVGDLKSTSYSGNPYGATTSDEVELTVDGVTYKTPINYLEPLTLEVNKVKDRGAGQVEKIREEVDRTVTESLYIQKPRADQKQQYQMILANQDFAREFGIPKEAADNISVYGRNAFGTFYNFTEVDEKKMGGLTKEKLIDNIKSKGGSVYKLEGRDIFVVPHDAGVGVNDEFFTEPKLRPVESYFDHYRAQSSDTSVTTPAGIAYEPGNVGHSFGFTMMVSDGVPTYFPIYLGPLPNGKGKIIRNGTEGFSSVGAAAQFLNTNLSNPKTFEQDLNAY